MAQRKKPAPQPEPATMTPATMTPAAGPRIYNLFPRLVGPVAAWQDHLPRIADMRFDWVYVNPFHEVGFSGSLYAVKNYYRLDPMFRGDNGAGDDDLLRDFTQAAAQAGLRVLMDLVINHTGKDSVLVAEHPEWFARETDGAVRSPFAVDPADTSRVTVWGDLAEIDFTPRPEREALIAYWCDLVRHYARLGFGGFRCDAAYKVPPEVWRPVIAAGREVNPHLVFAAETLGCTEEQVLNLAGCGFDYLFNSAKWWDFRSDWLLDQYELFRSVAPSIAFPESHDTERYITELAHSGITDAGEVERLYRQRYLFAAIFSTGVMMPIGYEFGFGRKLDVVTTTPAAWENTRFDLSAFIADVNAMKAALPPLNEEGPQRRVTRPGALPVGLLRETEDRRARCLSVINPSPRPATAPSPQALDLPAGIEVRIGGEGIPITPRQSLALAPYETKVFYADAAILEQARRPEEERVHLPRRVQVPAGRPIQIIEVRPEIDCGRFAVKREVGDTLEVHATVFREGHDRIAAALLYRRAGERAWREVPMTLVNPGLDLWRGAFYCASNARYEYTIEGWPDEWGSWHHGIEAKLHAGQDVGVELLEGRALVAAARGRIPRGKGREDAQFLDRVLKDFDANAEQEARARLLLAPALTETMARWPDRAASTRYDKILDVFVDRVEARFAAWYEFFPRSITDDPRKSGTFRSSESRLPAIRDMGFDVVYFPPIHPIGRAFRKGKNNTLTPGPEDVGSPYAIGGEEGGHDAIHPDLGTLEDFRHFVAAARAHNLEVALDFAIQCSPDHPWVREHPEWFTFRPDGTIKYAENPPKKYQDIVNVNFYGPHQEALWTALRDVLLFWIEQGVKTFRVDNPHTKPVPFWHWVIRDLQDRHPDVIFLSEAFTRPPMLKMLAKIGFTQSYTYFTWRNFKQELTEYLTELTQTEVKEYLRPNFFANTPDILPFYLQTGGRPAFRIRLVLAATLSSVYGIYSGFELCENAALPEREEYLDSEKYEIRPRNWNAPGNIIDDVTKVNWIRRENPALQELENLRFYPAYHDQILFYGKMTPDRRNMIFVAVNLDPFEAHEAVVEFPLDEMNIPDSETFEVEELLSGAKHLWRGRQQHVRLDPHHNPAAIFRVTPWIHIDYRSPCF